MGEGLVEVFVYAVHCSNTCLQCTQVQRKRKQIKELVKKLSSLFSWNCS